MSAILLGRPLTPHQSVAKERVGRDAKEILPRGVGGKAEGGAMKVWASWQVSGVSVSSWRVSKESSSVIVAVWRERSQWIVEGGLEGPVRCGERGAEGGEGCRGSRRFRKERAPRPQ